MGRREGSIQGEIQDRADDGVIEGVVRRRFQGGDRGDGEEGGIGDGNTMGHGGIDGWRFFVTIFLLLSRRSSKRLVLPLLCG